MREPLGYWLETFEDIYPWVFVSQSNHTFLIPPDSLSLTYSLRLTDSLSLTYCLDLTLPD
jgi:hypothetical protein